MKKPFLTFVLTLMLTASLAACTTTSTDTGTATGRSNGTVMDGRARNGSGGGDTMNRAGRYYADDKGEVYGDNDGIGNDIGNAAGDMMNGVGNAVNDMTH